MYTEVRKDQLYQSIIEDYIVAYNNMNVEEMLKNMHPHVKFENITGGEITLSTNGIDELRKQATEATAYFTQRYQRITDYIFSNEHIEINIEFTAIFSPDFPDTSLSGKTIELKGKSIFKFRDNKIIYFADIS